MNAVLNVLWRKELLILYELRRRTLRYGSADVVCD